MPQCLRFEKKGVICTETDIMLFRELDGTGKTANIHILNGQPFRASIDSRPMSGEERLTTKFEYT